MEERKGVDLECGKCDGIGRVCNLCGEAANSEINDDMCEECYLEQQKETITNG